MPLLAMTALIVDFPWPSMLPMARVLYPASYSVGLALGSLLPVEAAAVALKDLRGRPARHAGLVIDLAPGEALIGCRNGGLPVTGSARCHAGAAARWV